MTMRKGRPMEDAPKDRPVLVRLRAGLTTEADGVDEPYWWAEKFAVVVASPSKPDYWWLDVLGYTWGFRGDALEAWWELPGEAAKKE